MPGDWNSIFAMLILLAALAAGIFLQPSKAKRKKIFQKCYILLKIKHIKSDAKKYNKKVQTKQRKKR